MFVLNCISSERMNFGGIVRSPEPNALSKLFTLSKRESLITIKFYVNYNWEGELTAFDFEDGKSGCYGKIRDNTIKGKLIGLESDIKELLNGHVHIRDKEYVGSVLEKMIKDGPEKLQIVADFDRTLSKYTHRGNICATCHNVLEEHGLPKEYAKEAHAIRDKYFPIEVDPNLTIEEKIPHMVEWWTKAHELLLKYPLSKSLLHDMVAHSSARLRDGCQNFFNKLHKKEIPLLIFSAGVGDVIREIINQNSSTFYSNMHIVSNEIDFDSEGQMVGWKGDIIHVFNKNEAAVHDSDYFQNLNHRVNILLMGDSLGDLHMADGAEHMESKLTIGFLNTRVEDSLELYKSKYDIVIVQDETLDVVNCIVDKILGVAG